MALKVDIGKAYPNLPLCFEVPFPGFLVVEGVCWSTQFGKITLALFVRSIISTYSRTKMENSSAKHVRLWKFSVVIFSPFQIKLIITITFSFLSLTERRLFRKGKGNLH